MSYQFGNAQIGVTFVGDMGNLQRTLDQAGGSVERFGKQASTSMALADYRAQELARGFSRVSLTTGQMRAAMNGVPAQFTDMVTSLQGGQRPLTVFLQQGGQLRDMFGGIGPAAQAMGKYLLGLITPFTVGAAAIGTAGVAAYQGAQELHALNKTLILTGGAAGMTADELMDAAAAVDAMSRNVSQSRAAEVMNDLVQANVRGETQLKRYALAAAEFEAAGGGAASKVAEAFADLGRNPLAASAKLTASMGYLSAATYEQIRALDKQGRTVEAARIAQDAYAAALESRTPELLDNLGAIERGWLAVKNGAAEAWDAMLGIGRQDTLSEQIAKVEKRLADARAHKTLGAGNGFDIEDPRTAADTALLGSLREQQLLARRAADLKAQRVLRENERIAALQEKDRKNRSGAGRQSDALGDLLGRLGAQDAGLDPSFSRDLDTLYKGYEKGRIGVDAYRLAVDRLITSQRFYKQQVEAEESANKSAARSLEDSIRAAERAADVATANARAMHGEASTYGMTELQLHQLAQARLSDAAASLRQRAAIMENIDLSGRASDAMRAEADALDDLAQAKVSLYNKRQFLSSDETIAEAVRINGRVTARLSTDLADSISDGILDGARRGASTLDIFRNEMRAQFARTVLRPIIQPVAEGMNTAVGAIMNGLVNAMGMGATSSGYNPGAGADGAFSSSAWEGYVANAKGNVFSGPGISAYSSQVVNQPTVFPFARGVGLMGEAGPEAIMPLRRGADGRLGVSAQGGGGVTVNFINQSGQPLTATKSTRTAGDGSVVVDMVVQLAEARIADGLANRSGSVARGLEAGYGVRPVVS